MSTDPKAVLWMLFSLWFVVYWIFGGVFFAIIASTRFIHTRKAVFSCVFTLGSVAAAYGAAVTGMILANMNRGVAHCPPLGPDALRAFGNLLTCNYSAVFVSGGLFFAIILIGGMVALLASRVDAKGKS